MTKAIVEDVVNSTLQRFLADGVHYRDVIDIRAATPNWEAWPEVWSRFAADCERRAEQSLAGGARRTAGEDFARASLY